MWYLIKRATRTCATPFQIHLALVVKTFRSSWGLSRSDDRAEPIAMRALRLIADRKLELADIPPPPPPGEGEVQVRIKAVALNHLDLWGFRGMAFAKRQLP